MSDEEVDEKEKQAEAAYSDIMRQLLESDRFTRFFKINYDLHKNVDEENQTMSFQVIEVPPEVAEQRMTELMQEHMKEHGSQVTTATMEDLEHFKSLMGDNNDT